MLLLTDGSVIVQDGCTGSNWWKLQPDVNGSYVNGTWSQIASLPSGYMPEYFASAVLPDGRVVIEGGEYNDNSGNPVWTNRGAIYNPVANRWRRIAPPKGVAYIGDAESSVLANGTFMLGGCCDSSHYLLNPSTLKWTATGSGKADSNNEEGLSLLSTGNLLTVDANNGQDSELYSPSTGIWSSAGPTPAALSNGELGPQLLRPNGTVFAAGATGANAVYTVSTGTWSAGPSFPVIGGQQYDIADGPAAILPNGQVLMAASPGEFLAPTHFFVFNGKRLKEVADAPNAANTSSYFGFMMVLPTGQVLYNDRSAFFGVYTATGSPLGFSRPKITTVATSLARGRAYTVSGLQLNGLTQGSAYGDDYQSATNYPLVRITNKVSGHVVYARTSAISAMSVAPDAPSSAKFAIPSGTEIGASTLSVVANGIASKPVSVTIR